MECEGAQQSLNHLFTSAEPPLGDGGGEAPASWLLSDAVPRLPESLMSLQEEDVGDSFIYLK